MELTSILDECLRRLAAGESPADILASHPQHASELAPMLNAAAGLAGLSRPHLSEAQRLAAKVTLREVAAARAAPQPWFIRLRSAALPVALVLAAVVFVVLSVSAVASSQPGDAIYALRVIAERAPVLIRFTPAARASAELAVADRRLTDVSTYLATSGEVYPTALDALLDGDAAAAQRAEHLPGQVRAEIAGRMEAHAAELSALAATAPNPTAAEQLRVAAARANSLASQLGDGALPPSPPTAPGAGPSPSNGHTPPAATPAPVPSATVPVPTATPSPLPVSPQPTLIADPTVTPRPHLLLTLMAVTPGRTRRPTFVPPVQPSGVPITPSETPVGPTATSAPTTPVGPGSPPSLTWTPRPTHTARPELPRTRTRVPPQLPRLHTPTPVPPTSEPVSTATPVSAPTSGVAPPTDEPQPGNPGGPPPEPTRRPRRVG